MLARTPFLAVLCCLAGTLCIASGSAGCDWKPVARSVQPERLFDGATRVESVLPTGRYVLIRHRDDEGTERLAISDWNNRTVCELPVEVRRFERALSGPTGERDKAPFFLLPLVVQEGDKQALRFVDERCRQYGEYGIISVNVRSFAMDDDGREVLMHGNGSGVVSLADPWRGTTNIVAERVTTFRPVARSGPGSPLLFWFLESGKLTQRALDGSVQLTLGNAVTAFQDGMFDTLRVAYVDAGDLYEAVGPNFKPVLIGKEACEPVYRGDSLDRFEPCAKRQLVRTGLYSGDTETFDEGVFSSYTEAGINFQLSTDAMGATHMFARPAGRAKVEIVPPFQARPLVLDSTHAAGLVDCKRFQAALHPDGAEPDAGNTNDSSLPLDYDPYESIPCANGESSFALWSYGENRSEANDAEAGQSAREVPAPVFHRIVELLSPIPDTRNGSFWWVTLHRVRNDEQRLSIFDQRTMRLEEIATGVPRLDPLANGRSVRGYSIDRQAPYAVPLLLYSEHAQLPPVPDAGDAPSDPPAADAGPPLLQDGEKVPRGTLHVRLISGELDSTVANDVSSFVLVTSPLLGVLYGVEVGENAGLWFAAL